MRFPAGTTITVLRSGGRDRRGNPLPEVEHVLHGWEVSPRASEEATDRSDAVVTGAVTRGPMLPEYQVIGGIKSTDRIRVPTGHPMAGTWRVEGEPGPFVSPFTGWVGGVRVALTREA